MTLYLLGKIPTRVGSHPSEIGMRVLKLLLRLGQGFSIILVEGAEILIGIQYRDIW